MTQPPDLSFDLNLLFDDLADAEPASRDEPRPHAIDALLAEIADAEIRDIPLPEVLLPF